MYVTHFKEGFSCNRIGLGDAFSTPSSHDESFGDGQHSVWRELKSWSWIKVLTETVSCVLVT